MSHIQAIVLDLDGTLLGSDKRISPRNYQAVKRCHDSGIPIIIATARPPRAANQFAGNLPFVDYLVYYNGALVTCKSKQTQRHISIPNGISRQINHFLERNAPQLLMTYEVNDSWYAHRPIPDSLHAQFGLRANDPQPLVMDREFIQALAPTKILIQGHVSWREIADRFGDEVNVIATDGGGLIQIMHKSASKEEGVQWALHDIGVKWDNVMVFGDDYNDFGLFQKAGFPVAMGNAIIELKQCAAHITDTNDHDGVAIAIERFGPHLL